MKSELTATKARCRLEKLSLFSQRGIELPLSAIYFVEYSRIDSLSHIRNFFSLSRGSRPYITCTLMKMFTTHLLNNLDKVRKIQIAKICSQKRAHGIVNVICIRFSLQQILKPVDAK